MAGSATVRTPPPLPDEPVILAVSAVPLPLCSLTSTSANIGFGNGNGIWLQAATISSSRGTLGPFGRLELGVRKFQRFFG